EFAQNRLDRVEADEFGRGHGLARDPLRSGRGVAVLAAETHASDEDSRPDRVVVGAEAVSSRPGPRDRAGRVEAQRNVPERAKARVDRGRRDPAARDVGAGLLEPARTADRAAGRDEGGRFVSTDLDPVAVTAGQAKVEFETVFRNCRTGQ